MSLKAHAAWAIAAAALALFSASVASSRAERRREAVELELRDRLRKSEVRAREVERPTPTFAPAPAPAVEIEAPAAEAPRPRKVEEPKPLETLSRPERLLRLRGIFSGGDRKAQLAALDQLAPLGGPEAVELALALLTEGPPWLRRKAVETLGLLNDAAALPALQKLYQDDPGLRVPAALAMARLGQALPLQELTSQATLELRGPDAGLRERAVATLGRIGTPEVLPHLSQALLDPDARVRKEAVESLAATRRPEAVALLQAALPGAEAHTQDWIRKELRELASEK